MSQSTCNAVARPSVQVGRAKASSGPDARGPVAHPSQPAAPGFRGPSLVRIDLWAGAQAQRPEARRPELVALPEEAELLPGRGAALGAPVRSGSAVRAGEPPTRPTGAGWHLTTRGLAVVMTGFLLAMAMGLAIIVHAYLSVGSSPASSAHPDRTVVLADRAGQSQTVGQGHS